MTDTPPTAADEIRAAAHRLRDLAAAANDGPWTATPDVLVGGWAVARAPMSSPEGPYLADFVEEGDARYIAAMGPQVGAALAAWLEAYAYHLAHSTHPGWQEAVSLQPLAVARAINGQTDGSGR